MSTATQNDWFFDIFRPTAPVGKRKAKRPRNHYLIATVIGVVLTALSYAVGLAAGWIEDINYLEVFAVFTSYVSTWLSVVEKRFNYVAGAISSFAYAILFVQSDLVASAILNFYLAPTLVYGYLRWGKDAVSRPVEHVKARLLPLYTVVTLAAYGGAYLLVKAFGGSMAWTDSAILIGTLLAQFLLDNKKLETWMVWAVVNVFAIYTYFTADLQLVGFQYIFFLLNTVVGFIAWRNSMRRTN